MEKEAENLLFKDQLIQLENYHKFIEDLNEGKERVGKATVTQDNQNVRLIYAVAKMCIEKGGYNVDIHADDNEMSVSFYPWCD